jgi:hypothetical protein
LFLDAVIIVFVQVAEAKGKQGVLKEQQNKLNAMRLAQAYAGRLQTPSRSRRSSALDISMTDMKHDMNRRQKKTGRRFDNTKYGGLGRL